MYEIEKQQVLSYRLIQHVRRKERHTDNFSIFTALSEVELKCKMFAMLVVSGKAMRTN